MANETPPPVSSVSVTDLAEARSEGRLDSGVASVLGAELAYIDALRAKRDRPGRDQIGLSGLCISGGGIRSATFATGVLQALAAGGKLKDFDYLSSVSGGGYIASSVTWLLSKMGQGTSSENPQFGVDPRNFPYGTENPNPSASGDLIHRDTVDQIKMYQYLKSHGQYLTPGKGITLMSLLAVIIRAMFLSLIVAIPITAAVYTFLQVLPERLIEAFTPELDVDIFVYLRAMSYVTIVLLAVASVIYSLVIPDSKSHEETPIKYRLRRLYDRYSGLLLTIAATTFAVSLVPMIKSSIGGAALLSGLVLGGLIFIFTSIGKTSPVPMKIFTSLAACLFLYGLFVVSHRVGGWASNTITGTIVEREYALPLGEFWPFWIPYVGLSVALLCGRFINLNYISISRYYRDRLMETFMPDINSAMHDVTGPSHTANSARLCDLISVENPNGPYHILNTNLNLSGADSRLRRNRGGDNFILSPFYCGSSETGWRSTKEFLNGGLTLATATAVSGAAAAPNSGVGGKGVTRDASVSIIMTLLNLTLGFWIPHPMRKQKRFTFPNHFNPVLLSLLVNTYNVNRKFLELGDGGFFENLSLYEMIRRRMRLIVVSDAGADPDYRFDDLLNAMQKVQVDFGVKIGFEVNGSPINPQNYFKSDNSTMPEFGHLAGTINYSDGSKGVIILIKASIIKDLDLHIMAYKDKNPEFPHQSTADQSFTDDQVDAYRRLGYEITRRMIAAENERL